MLGPLLEIRLADVIDILLVTALVSTAIVWVRRTQALLVATGILILGGVYVAARALGLQLTAWILQGFFAIFVIIVVIIFQEELRQLFERLAVWSLRRGERARLGSEAADVLVEALTELARERRGALVVLPGVQPIGRHVRGGIELDGRLSAPLLRSIFDPHSPGHDGAVIVEGDRVARFATHLPLSHDARQLAGVGTRHAAALGLAELTDALCLVVSEERGTVSVAQDGALRALPSPQALAPVLARFLAARRPAPERGAAWRLVLRESWVEKAASFVLVVGLWYVLVPGARPKQETFEVPVRVTGLPEDLVLESVSPETVRATFSGLSRDFYLFDSRRLEVTVDASLARLGRRTFQIADADLRYPKALTLEELDPARVKIAVHAAAGGEAPAAPGGAPAGPRGEE
jgi:diadenylate cyclase